MQSVEINSHFNFLFQKLHIGNVLILPIITGLEFIQFVNAKIHIVLDCHTFDINIQLSVYFVK